MNKYYKMTNDLSRSLSDSLPKEQQLVAVRVFQNCLMLYFNKGRCTFYSKSKQDWGNTQAIYFVADNFNVKRLSKRLREQYEPTIDWVERYLSGTAVQKVWLTLEYKIKHEV